MERTVAQALEFLNLDVVEIFLHFLKFKMDAVLMVCYCYMYILFNKISGHLLLHSIRCKEYRLNGGFFDNFALAWF